MAIFRVINNSRIDNDKRAFCLETSSLRQIRPANKLNRHLEKFSPEIPPQNQTVCLQGPWSIARHMIYF